MTFSSRRTRRQWLNFWPSTMNTTGLRGNSTGERSNTNSSNSKSKTYVLRSMLKRGTTRNSGTKSRNYAPRPPAKDRKRGLLSSSPSPGNCRPLRNSIVNSKRNSKGKSTNSSQSSTSSRPSRPHSTPSWNTLRNKRTHRFQDSRNSSATSRTSWETPTLRTRLMLDRQGRS